MTRSKSTGHWRPSALFREALLFSIAGRLLSTALVVVSGLAIALSLIVMVNDWGRTQHQDADLHFAGRDVWTFSGPQGVSATRCDEINQWSSVEAAGGVAAGVLVDGVVHTPFTGSLLQVLGATAPGDVVANVALGPSATDTARYPNATAIINGEQVAAVKLPGNPRLDGYANSVLVRNPVLTRIDTCYVGTATDTTEVLVPAIVSQLTIGDASVEARQLRVGPSRSELFSDLHQRPTRWIAPTLGGLVGLVGVGIAIARRSELALYRDLSMTATQVSAVICGSFLVLVGTAAVIGTGWALATTTGTDAHAFLEPFVVQPMTEFAIATLAVNVAGTLLAATSLSMADRR
jgi:hypothetical protein